MSTFFNKISGGYEEPTEPVTEEEAWEEIETPEEPRQEYEVRSAVARTTLKRKAPAETHLNVEEEDNSDTTATPGGDEEGELTVDIYNKPDAIVIQSTVAGVAPEDLDVSITNDSVTIRGSREKQEEVSESDYYYKELFWGSFSRSVILPEEIDEENAEAVLKYGLLTITLPKKRKKKVQKVKIKVT